LPNGRPAVVHVPVGYFNYFSPVTALFCLHSRGAKIWGFSIIATNVDRCCTVL